VATGARLQGCKGAKFQRALVGLGRPRGLQARTPASEWTPPTRTSWLAFIRPTKCMTRLAIVRRVWLGFSGNRFGSRAHSYDGRMTWCDGLKHLKFLPMHMCTCCCCVLDLLSFSLLFLCFIFPHFSSVTEDLAASVTVRLPGRYLVSVKVRTQPQYDLEMHVSERFNPRASKIPSKKIGCQ
jgi:hypothetical protein